MTDLILEITDFEVHALTRWSDPIDNIIHLSKRINKKERIILHYGDLNDFSLLKVVNTIRPEFVFHLAAQSFPRTSFDSPLETLNTNISVPLIYLRA